MSMLLSIHPVSDSLEMYGSPDKNSAYSLSGVVTISDARLLLQSLSLTFEGQSEIYTPSTGYSSLRLCSIKLSNEGHEDDEVPCKWDVVFNLAIPAWLPASTCLGIEDIGIRYGLYATAEFINLDDEAAPWQIKLHRYVLPPHIEPAGPSLVNYLVNPKSSKDEVKRIPQEVLAKIQVLASVPETLNTDESLLPITVRLRTKDLESAECKKLQISEVGIDIIQHERSRHKPSATFLSKYPLPPKEMQPPNLPLLDPHPMSNIYDVGLYVSKDHSESICRSFTLLPPGESGRYQLSDNNYVFGKDAEQGANPTWYTMETRVPFVHLSQAKSDQATEEWAGPAIIRPSSSSPLFSVQHEVSLSLTFTYDLAGSKEKVQERLNFRIPLSFGRYLPVSRSVPASPSGGVTRDLPLALPSYSQLYDSNGERKIDYSIPLPRYTPKDVSPPQPELELEASVSASEKPESHTASGKRSPSWDLAALLPTFTHTLQPI
ncbi:hypothetical protein BKA70DRAFT_1366646 [Coprinopsis sp. MPI-PUGE-AT-0042]|nr:hypothetical protein BKA70DRAFT_1366646 [Coprinopsis sp. MPI-PUGE-AT-0042]